MCLRKRKSWRDTRGTFLPHATNCVVWPRPPSVPFVSWRTWLKCDQSLPRSIYNIHRPPSVPWPRPPQSQDLDLPRSLVQFIPQVMLPASDWPWVTPYFPSQRVYCVSVLDTTLVSLSWTQHKKCLEILLTECKQLPSFCLLNCDNKLLVQKI